MFYHLVLHTYKQALDYAVRKAAEKAGMGQPSRNRKLSCAGVIRLLIGAEEGSLAKELHRTDIDVTPPPFHSAVHKSARRHSGTYSTVSILLARIAETFAAIVCWRGWNVRQHPAQSQRSFFRSKQERTKRLQSAAPEPAIYLCNKTFYDALIQPEPQKDEIGALIEMLKRNHFLEKTIIIADRGYESYNVVAHLVEKPNTDFLIRIKQNRFAMREVARLPIFELDCDISFTITATQTNEDKQKRYIFLQVPQKSKLA